VYPAGSLNADGTLIGTPTASTIYSDQDGDSTTANPMATDTDGTVSCFLAIGSYDVRYHGGDLGSSVEAEQEAQVTSAISSAGDVELGSPTVGDHSYLYRLRLRSVDAPTTKRTYVTEIDGDTYVAVNATYDETDTFWYRIDNTKVAYLLVLHSENDIQNETYGGFGFWVATVDGTALIGNWTSAKFGVPGGWQRILSLNEDLEAVFQGMQLTLTGNGALPYGRLVHLAHDDASGESRTILAQGASYQGSDQWALDEALTYAASAFVLDEGGDWEWWYYPADSPTPFATSDWKVVARLAGSDSSYFGLFAPRRISSVTNALGSSIKVIHVTSADMVDGFGAGIFFVIEDSAGVENIIGRVYCERAGADNQGDMVFSVYLAGVETEALRLRGSDGAVLSDRTVKFDKVGMAVETGTTRTLTSADYGRVILFTANGAITVTLPAAAVAAGTWIRCICEGDTSQSITYSAPIADTMAAEGDTAVDSVSFAAAARPGSAILLISDGTRWWAVNESGPSSLVAAHTMTVTS